MKAIGISILRDGVAVLQDKSNLDDPRNTSTHQSIAKHNVNHCAQWQMLRMSRHSPASEENDETWDEVPLGSTIPLPAQPDTSKTSTPPDDTHRRMLNIIGNPSSSPTVFREGVDATPSCNDQRVEELLRSPCALQPSLAHEHDNREEYSVRDECATHDEVCETLS